MDCRAVQDGIVESLTTPRRAALPADMHVHLAGCPACTAFAARHAALDERLASAFVAPGLPPGFRDALRARVRREKRRSWAQVLPDVVHFASFGAATLACAMFLPAAAALVAAIGAGSSLLSYVFLATFRDVLEDAG